MSRPIVAIVDLHALRNNLAVARHHAGSARVMAVVKANAYGHGLGNVLPALTDADAIAVVELESAVFARDRGYVKPLVLLEGFFSQDELARFVELSLTAVVHCAEQIEMLRSARLTRPIDVHIKINTGMNRLGFAPEELSAVTEALRGSGNVRELVAMTHFADADGKHGVDWQLERFNAAISGLSLSSCMANSAALLRYPQTRGGWVRPGIMLYGASPFADVSANTLGLRPVMTLRSRVIAVQNLRPGDSVGYSRTFIAPRAMRIGVIACGYGDGYPRHAPTGSPVTISGQRVATVGLVSMDMLCVDLSTVSEAGVGSEVTLWGDGLPVEEVATAAGTVSYELLCALKSRVPVEVRQ